jgi:hypothetical protein
MTLSHTSGLTKEAMDKLKAEYMKTQLQMAQQQQAHINAHQQALGAYTTTTTSPSWTTLGMQSSPIPIEVPVHKLDEGAWDIPISQLVDLWTVRYGSKWVNEDELDEFYKITAKRLRALHKVESHYVNGNDVFRIVE